MSDRTRKRARRATAQASAATQHAELSNYQLGRAFVIGLCDAALATLERRADDAEQHAMTADYLLWPLGEMDDPEDLRDFIAGAASEAEARLLLLDDCVNGGLWVEPGE